MKTNNKRTVVINKVEYTVENYAASMAVSSAITKEGRILVNANLKLQPFAVIDGNKIPVELDNTVALMSDVFNSTDTDVLTCIGKINAALEEYVLAKNI